MESHSSESSPRSREIKCETVSHHRPPPAASARVKLMCSYGGRILLRPHDNQLSYVGGETKILAVDRSVRFPAFLARVASLLPAHAAAGDVVCFKYQLPGEDLDALISVTDDEDLDQMMIEYDHLARLASRPSPRFRLFLFVSSSATAAPPEGKKVEQRQRQWFDDALSSPTAPKQPPSHTVSAAPSPDFLFGLDKSSVPVPEPAVASKDEPETEIVPVPEPAVASKVEPETEIVSPPAVVSSSSSEIQRQVEELQSQHIAAAENNRQWFAAAENNRQWFAAAENDQEVQRQHIEAADNHQQMQRQQFTENHQVEAAENHQEMQPQQIAAAENHQELARFQIPAAENQQQAIQMNGRSDDVVAATRVPVGDYYMKAGTPEAAQLPAGYWAEQKPSGGGREQQAVFLMPASPGMFPGQPGAYYAAVTRMVPAAGTGYQVAYDSAGRAVYYARAVVPTYQMAGPTGAGVVEDSKPAHVS